MSAGPAPASTSPPSPFRDPPPPLENIMKSRLGLLVILCTPAIALANPELPTSDAPDSADSPVLKRFEGSIIVSYENKRFDELTVPLSKLEYVVPARRNRDNNTVVEPK